LKLTSPMARAIANWCWDFMERSSLLHFAPKSAHDDKWPCGSEPEWSGCDGAGGQSPVRCSVWCAGIGLLRANPLGKR